jgi:hypothetical protein
MLSPNLELVGEPQNQFVTGGLFPRGLTNRPAPPTLLQQFQADTNLVFYDWEITQPNAFGLIQMTQLGRFIFGRARLSMTNNPGLAWVTTISTNLGPAGTAIRLSSQQQLVFSRTSTIGLTGAEAHLFIEWLESPGFPKGLFSLDAPPPAAAPLELQVPIQKP